MKNILFLFVSVFALAQNPNHQTFLDHNWRLNFVQDGNNAPVYVAYNINYLLEFSDENPYYKNYIITVCGWHSVNFAYIENKNYFLYLGGESSMAICEGPNYPIDIMLFDTFVANFTIHYDSGYQYSFVLTLQPDDNQYDLDIYNPFGERLNFKSTGLSSENNALYQTKIYPNPVLDFLTINSNIELKSLILYQMNGQKVYESQGQTKSIDMSQMASGVYILVIKDAEDVITNKKIIKK